MQVREEGSKHNHPSVMQVLRLLAARRRPRRAVSTISAAHSEEDEGPFFDLDFSSSSVRASSSSSSDESDDACSSELDDFIISLHRSRSASPSFFVVPRPAPPLLQFCASEPSTKAGQGLLLLEPQYKPRRTTNLRTLSFGGANKNKKAAAFYGGRPSFASSTRSLRLFMESPSTADDDAASDKRGGSGDVIRRYLTNISRRLRRRVRPRSAAGDARGRLRKSRSAAVTVLPSRRDDSLIEKQDSIASAIAHCKESFHRASLSECDSSLLRSRSDPGQCEASSS